MTEATAPTENEPTSAYDLLSKETLEITDADALIIIKSLREKRKAFLAGKADNPAKAKKALAAPTSAAQKAANTQALLAGLDLKLPGA